MNEPEGKLTLTFGKCGDKLNCRYADDCCAEAQLKADEAQLKDIMGQADRHEQEILQSLLEAENEIKRLLALLPTKEEAVYIRKVMHTGIFEDNDIARKAEAKITAIAGGS